MIGSTISHYKILDKLGEGGMGVVYLAEDTRLARRVALKLLPPGFAHSAQARARFLHEARTAASLNHPNICTVYEVDEIDGQILLGMEHIEGECLTDRIARGPMKIREVAAAGIAIADGLSAAHRAGIVHRDIKPGNVMVASDGRVKILDFGLALAPEMTRLTREGRTTGTVSYMSPEQSRGGVVDQRSDIWSLGVVLYEMVTGRRPFSGDHEQAVLRSILDDSPEPPSALRTGIPLELERIITKAMAKGPDDRYQHVDDMIVDLRGVERSTSERTATAVTGTPAGGSADAATHLPASGARRMAVLWAVVAVAVVAAVSAYLWGSLNRAREIAVPAPDRVLVAAFENRSGDTELAYIGQTLATSVSDGLTATGIVSVVPHLTEAMGDSDPSARGSQGAVGPLLAAARDAGASVLVTGSYRVEKDSLLVETRILDARDGSAVSIVAGESGPVEQPDIAIGKARSRVMGALAARADPTIGEDVRSHAPTYEAYREYELGMKHLGIQSEVSRAHFRRALGLDPEFVYVQLFDVGALMMLDRFAEADSLVGHLRSQPTALPPHLKLFLDAFAARIHGDYEQALRKLREIVRLAPRHYMSRRFLAIIALMLNRPNEAVAALEQLRRENVQGDIYLDSWTYAGLSRAYHMLGDHRRELRILDQALEKYPDVRTFRFRRAWALGALGRVSEIEELIEETSSSPVGEGGVGLLMMHAANELIAHGYGEEGLDVAGRAADWYRSRGVDRSFDEQLRKDLGQALYSAGRWAEAHDVFSGLATDFPEDIDYRGYLATLAARAGDIDTATEIKKEMLAIDDPYDYGMNTYWAACISAQLGQNDEAMELLRRSYSEGAGLGLHVHKDIDLEPLWSEPEFKRFIAPRD
jgi:tetratricopeptide (TPR) repeat protein